ncbi:MAG: Eco57I restriction-modification methylase domain-containing protein [Alsobacter sp.]
MTAAVTALSSGGIEERGAIFTRREVVDFILDLAGYTTDKPLLEMRLLEPSFGDGDFLIPAIDRLLDVWKLEGKPDPVLALADCIRAVELHRLTFIGTRERVAAYLQERGIDEADAHQLADAWLIYGDFLLADIGGLFDVVVGNPPYVRQELIPDVLMAEYRSRYRTIYDRADIYIPFIERSLLALSKGGSLGFICADRWMKNRYGGPLRELVATKFHLRVYVDMVDTPAFHSDVIAYPAITIITREKPGPTRIAHRPAIDREQLSGLATSLSADLLPANDQAVREMHSVTAGSEPWILDSSDQLALVRRIEKAFPAIEDAGCKVGIGVATGADQAFIAPFETLDVEADRKLPLVMTRDIMDGVVAWRGFGVINPFNDDGGLVDLARYPKLARYLERHKDAIAKRHVAQKIPGNWYRTIDRIYPALAAKPKLLIPDIKGEAHIVYEEGRLYPHHNLYFITSDSWDLHALQAVLLSGIARLFVATYSTKMRGGYLRFQAQYLRRIHIPHWTDVSAGLRKKLKAAGQKRDIEACNAAAFELFDLTEQEQSILGGSGN